MKSDDPKRNDHEADVFASAGAEARGSFFADYLHFLKRTRKWWLVPLIVILLLFGGLFILASTGGAPFIYALF